MGFSPREVDEMDFWEFQACVDAFARANGNEPTIKAPTDEEFYAATGQSPDDDLYNG